MEIQIENLGTLDQYTGWITEFPPSFGQEKKFLYPKVILCNMHFDMCMCSQLKDQNLAAFVQHSFFLGVSHAWGSLFGESVLYLLL